MLARYWICCNNTFQILLCTICIPLQAPKGVKKYLQSTINWGIYFHCHKRLNLPDFSPSVWYDIKNDLSVPFDIDLNQPLLICFVNSVHTNNLCKCCSNTGLVFTFCGGAIVYKSKMQSLIGGSSTKAEFIAAHTAAKNARYLRMVLNPLFILILSGFFRLRRF